MSLLGCPCKSGQCANLRNIAHHRHREKGTRAILFAARESKRGVLGGLLKNVYGTLMVRAAIVLPLVKGSHMWFNVDKQGLANILERKGKSFALFELLSNAWDAGASRVEVEIEPIPSSPYVKLTVTDNAEKPWADLDSAFTMFGKSERGGDSTKRGRFNLGEKLVLACSRTARIETMGGTLNFDDGKPVRRDGRKRSQGTMFTCEIRMTRDEMEQAKADVVSCLPPCDTRVNGLGISRPEPLVTFEARLPTEVADEDGVIRRTTRTCQVQVFSSNGEGSILEMGIPVCSIDMPWRLNVLQKVPLNMERDSVTDAFRRALQVAAVNRMASALTEEQATTTWASEALEDGRIEQAAVQEIVTKRFGDRAVIAVPGDPIANANAEAAGCQVIHGGSLSGGAWANVRKYAAVPTTSTAFPSPRPMNKPTQTCPACGQVVRA